MVEPFLPFHFNQIMIEIQLLERDFQSFRGRVFANAAFVVADDNHMVTHRYTLG